MNPSMGMSSREALLYFMARPMFRVYGQAWAPRLLGLGCSQSFDALVWGVVVIWYELRPRVFVVDARSAARCNVEVTGVLPLARVLQIGMGCSGALP